MSKTVTTAWTYATDGRITKLDLTDASRVVSARIRWRGLKRTDTAYNEGKYGWASRPAGVQDIFFGSLPSVPSGYSFYRHWLWTRIRSGSSGAYKIEHYIADSLVDSISGTASTAELNTYLYADESGIAAYVLVQHAKAYEYLTQWRTEGKKDVQTKDPQIIIEALGYQHVGTLNDGEISPWVDLHVLTANIEHAIEHGVDGSGRVSYQIEVTYDPRLPVPSREEPEAGHKTANRQPNFVLTLTEETDNSSTKYHARVQISSYTTMDPLLLVLESTEETGVWEVWDTVGEKWDPFPAGGVDPGSKVRVTPTAPLEYGSLYWDATSLDDWMYGYDTSAWNLRILLSIKGLYALAIDGDLWNAYSITVSEASNGEISNLVFEVNNEGGTAYTAIDYGDEIILGVIDSFGNEEEYIGKVREKNPSGRYLSVSGITGDGILAERRVKQDYTSQDIGVTIAHIITNYCQPITTTNVDLTTGFARAIQADGKKAIRVLEEMRREYGILYYVDKDWDLHLFKLEDIGDHLVEIRYGAE